MNVVKGSFQDKETLEIRFPEVGYERTFTGDVTVNGKKYNFAVVGNSIFVPGAPTSGMITVKVTGVRYPVLFPSYSFPFNFNGEI